MGNVAVVGAGIAGLAAAYRLMKAGHEVAVYEASDHVGGVIHSERAEGYLFEHGPNTIQSGGPVLDELIAELGLESQLVEASPAAKKRYVVRGGKPVALPSGPGSLLASPLFSGATKLRLLREPFLRGASDASEESVAAFFRRRFGQEVLDYAVNPFVAGIFAGSPEELSIRHAFPKLYEAERRHGSVIGGLIRQRRAARSEGNARPRRRMFSFREGMQTLPRALADALGEHVGAGARVTGLRRYDPRWFVQVMRKGAMESHWVDAVLLTVPLWRLPALTTEAELNLKSVPDVAYAPMNVLALGFPADAVRHPLDGFGMLVPEAEDRFRILGALFSSTLFSDRAPDGQVLITVFAGGQRRPDLAGAELPELLAYAQEDLRTLLGVQAEPTFVRHVPWPHAIPQYRLGYGSVKDALARLEEQHPRLYFAGSFRAGVSVDDTAAVAAVVAERIASGLG